MAWHDDWKKHPDGNLSLQPLVGFGTAAMATGMAGMVRLEYALDPARETHDAVQLVLTSDQAIELSDALRELADQIVQNLNADRPAGKPS